VNVRELWFTGPQQVELRSSGRRELVEGELRISALFSGISQGTELLLYSGRGPTPFDPSLDPPGAPMYPRRYGYAWVGEVIESSSVDVPPGRRVFGLLSHGEEHCVPSGSLRVLPEGVPPERAVLAANLETAINVVWDAAVALGDDVVVLGGGVVGTLCAYAAQLSGARVRVIEPSPKRRAAALAMGIERVIAPGEAAAARADVVVEATGDPACLNRAIELARDEGVIVVASFYGERVAPVALGSEFHRRRLTLRASQVSRLPPSRASGWSLARRFGLVTRLLATPALDALLERPVPFDQAPAVYGRLFHAPSESLQCIFSYRA